MRRNKRQLIYLLLAALHSVIGCAKTPEATAVDQEPAIRARFEELQHALKERDAEGLNRLLTIESQADTQGVAHLARLSFARANDKTREQYRKELGISTDEMMRFNGPMYLKTRPFLARYGELSDATLERVSVQGENATISYRNEHGEPDELFLVRQEGEWKFRLPMPPLRPAEEGKEKARKEQP